jgi:hypothetical protein
MFEEQMSGVDWQIIVTSLAFTLAIFLAWIAITMLRAEWKMSKINKSVQALFDEDNDE